MGLDRILSGKVFVRVSNDLVCVHPPDAELRYLADFLSQDIYDQSVAAGALTLDELDGFLREEGLWSKQDEEFLKQIVRAIDDVKVDYFKNFHFKSTLPGRKSRIRELEKQYYETSNRRLYLAEYTAESNQLLWRDTYIIERTAKLAGGGSATSKYGIERVMATVRQSRLLDDDIRGMAKSGEWRMMWTAMKVGANPFKGELTDEQLSLIGWSKTYDSVYESMECPSDDVIQDDTALDGWFITQSRQRKSEKMEKAKSTDAAEVFVPVNYRSDGKVEVKDVMEMNSPQAKQAMKKKMSELKARGSMNELDYSGTRAEMQMHANKQEFKR